MTTQLLDQIKIDPKELKYVLSHSWDWEHPRISYYTDYPCQKCGHFLYEVSLEMGYNYTIDSPCKTLTCGKIILDDIMK